jgi:hypothetical protein
LTADEWRIQRIIHPTIKSGQIIDNSSERVWLWVLT